MAKAKHKADDVEVMETAPEAPPVEPPTVPPVAVAKEEVPKNSVCLPKDEFAHLWFTIVALPIPVSSQWFGQAGKGKIANLLGAKTSEEIEVMWEEFKLIALKKSGF